MRAGGASSADILMTGDVSGAVLSRLAPKLYDGYYAVKAPHHGTESHYSPVLGDIAAAHLLISNGDYHAGGGDLAALRRYGGGQALHKPRRVRVVPHGGKLLQPPAALLRAERDAGRLTLRCPAAGKDRRTPCGIYVFSHSGAKGCHCD